MLPSPKSLTIAARSITCVEKYILRPFAFVNIVKCGTALGVLRKRYTMLHPEENAL